jgi:hypothetical protein
MSRLLATTQRVGLALMLALSALVYGPQTLVVQASSYNNTNPGTTPCGDGTHPVETARIFYIVTGGKVLARLEVRWSDFCDTVWAKVVNLTGTSPSTSYWTERSLTSDETVWTYSCPYADCLVATQTASNDVLPSNGSSGWSHQLDLPAGGVRGGAKQPPAVRFKGNVTTPAGNDYSYDSGIIAFWNWSLSGNTAGNVTCDNSIFADRCIWWGEPSAASKTVWYEIDASMFAEPVSTPTGTTNLGQDYKTIILPGWSQATARSPLMTWCTAPCNENVLVMAVPGSDIPGMAGATVIGGTSASPAVMTTGWIKIANDLNAFDHSCGTADDGCAGSHPDSRPVMAHETGHSIGFGHCNMDNGAQCHISSSLTNGFKEGNMYWTPQAKDIMGIKAMYP